MITNIYHHQYPLKMNCKANGCNMTSHTFNDTENLTKGSYCISM